MNNNNPAEEILANINKAVVMELVRQLCHHDGVTGRDGGVMACGVQLGATDQFWFASVSIGMPGPKCFNYAKNAAEKMNRLYAIRSSGKIHVASSTSADPDNPDHRLRTYGGCIFFLKGNERIFLSFSGAPPHIDEVAMFTVGINIGLMCPNIYDNPLLELAASFYKDIPK